MTELDAWTYWLKLSRWDNIKRQFLIKVCLFKEDILTNAPYKNTYKQAFIQPKTLARLDWASALQHLQIFARQEVFHFKITRLQAQCAGLDETLPTSHILATLLFLLQWTLWGGTVPTEYIFSYMALYFEIQANNSLRYTTLNYYVNISWNVWINLAIGIRHIT